MMIAGEPFDHGALKDLKSIISDVCSHDDTFEGRLIGGLTEFYAGCSGDHVKQIGIAVGFAEILLLRPVGSWNDVREFSGQLGDMIAENVTGVLVEQARGAKNGVDRGRIGGLISFITRMNVTCDRYFGARILVDRVLRRTVRELYVSKSVLTLLAGEAALRWVWKDAGAFSSLGFSSEGGGVRQVCEAEDETWKYELRAEAKTTGVEAGIIAKVSRRQRACGGAWAEEKRIMVKTACGMPGGNGKSGPSIRRRTSWHSRSPSAGEQRAHDTSMPSVCEHFVAVALKPTELTVDVGLLAIRELKFGMYLVSELEPRFKAVPPALLGGGWASECAKLDVASRVLDLCDMHEGNVMCAGGQLRLIDWRLRPLNEERMPSALGVFAGQMAVSRAYSFETPEGDLERGLLTGNSRKYTTGNVFHKVLCWCEREETQLELNMSMEKKVEEKLELLRAVLGKMTGLDGGIADARARCQGWLRENGAAIGLVASKGEVGVGKLDPEVLDDAIEIVGRYADAGLAHLRRLRELAELTPEAAIAQYLGDWKLEWKNGTNYRYMKGAECQE
jgi:hypothetical protein